MAQNMSRAERERLQKILRVQRLDANQRLVKLKQERASVQAQIDQLEQQLVDIEHAEGYLAE